MKQTKDSFEIKIKIIRKAQFTKNYKKTTQKQLAAEILQIVCVV